ncbi:non-homologous end-joining DNA ligase [Desulforamulus putei]|uniref:DNA ligase (ATP) n=1 Tax=Desulforamulus putei DSM 12395 TaxID=1121429 RepID=A0A1M4ZVB8_9FIRM|nr:non-homologous end-joining DNA ligase [Desulforamulus putei]SHF22003.1 DNA ligase-1 [Desulforamulus putei DSM 12395]
MLAVQARPFDHADYLYEIKWDGYRGLAYLDDQTTLLSRNQLDLTPRFPELQGLHLRVKEKPAVLDGEIVILRDGKPSFSALQARGKTSDILKVNRLSRQIPATFVAFDVLYRAGENVMGMAIRERKQILEQIIEQGPDLIISQYVIGSGIDFYRAVTAAGLEGVVAKRLDSPYLPGKRSAAWKKVRMVRSAELVICGWEKGEGVRSLGALILAGYRDREWIYMGKVGTGFTRDEEVRLLELLAPLKIPSPVFSPPRGELRQPTWVKPELVCEVTFSEISPDGRLRHPSYKGIRPDKLPQECTIQVD